MNKNRLVGSLIVHLGAANRVPVYNGGVGGGVSHPLGGSRCFPLGWMMQMSLLYLPLTSAWPGGIAACQSCET